MAQSGSALFWGKRGRGFKSHHADRLILTLFGSVSGVPLSAEAQREYAKRYYAKHRDDYLRRSRERRKRNKEWLCEIKDQPCVDCGLRWPPYVMDFHHRDPESKLLGVAKALVNKGRQFVLDEIAKCDLLCSNCHRIRTHENG